MINILIVDDHIIVREGIKRIINDTPDIRITGEAASSEEAMNLLSTNNFDLVILDIYIVLDLMN